MVLHLNEPNPFHPRMLCAKFCWNWLSSSGEEDYWISSMYFRYFLIISHWKYGEALNLVNLFSQLSPLGKGWGPSFEPTWIPFTQECIVASLVEITCTYFGDKLQKFAPAEKTSYTVSPLGKGRCPSFEQNWIPFTQCIFAIS